MCQHSVCMCVGWGAKERERVRENLVIGYWQNEKETWETMKTLTFGK